VRTPNRSTMRRWAIDGTHILAVYVDKTLSPSSSAVVDPLAKSRPAAVPSSPDTKLGHVE